jgi:2-methylcitrate dehydratase PrpD
MAEKIQQTAVAELAENTVKTRFDNFDKETVETVKGRLIDIIGCAIGGANATGNQELLNLVRGWGGKGEATILVHAGKALAKDAAMVNAVMTRSYDFEEQSPVAHQNASVMPTALAMGEMQKLSGKEFLAALIAGIDVGNRIYDSFDFDFFRGWDNIGSLHTFACAAIAGHVLKLTPEQMRNAFGLALHQTAGSIASYWDCDMTFKLDNGFAARTGIFMAELARAGMIGAIDALQGKFGYCNLYTPGCTHPEKLTQDLGKKYNISRDMYKQFPCGRPNHICIELGIALATRNNIKAEDIAEVTLRLPRQVLAGYYAKPWSIRSFPTGDALFNFRYTLASALMRRHVTPADMTEEAIRDPAINALIGKIDLKELPAEKRVRAEVIVKMKNGQEFTISTSAPDHGLQGREEIKAKFMDQVEFSKMVPVKNAEKLIQLLEKLEEVNNIGQIIELTLAKK